MTAVGTLVVGRRPSVTSATWPPKCFDNAVAETFFATLKKELIHRRSWPTKAELRTEVFAYIEAFYNRQRRHRYLGQLSPAAFEAAQDEALTMKDKTTTITTTAHAA